MDEASVLVISAMVTAITEDTVMATVTVTEIPITVIMVAATATIRTVITTMDMDTIATRIPVIGMQARELMRRHFEAIPAADIATDNTAKGAT